MDCGFVGRPISGSVKPVWGGVVVWLGLVRLEGGWGGVFGRSSGAIVKEVSSTRETSRIVLGRIGRGVSAGSVLSL